MGVAAFIYAAMYQVAGVLQRVTPIVISGVNTNAGLSSMNTLHLISGKMAPFVRAMLDSGEYDEFKPGMVLDMYQLLPEDYMKYIHGANCEIVYFITSDVTPEERFAIQKKYDTEKDYTFYKSDEELREGAVHIVEQSICMKEQCQKYGLPYFETAKDREQMFQQFLQDFNLLLIKGIAIKGKWGVNLRGFVIIYARQHFGNKKSASKNK